MTHDWRPPSLLLCFYYAFLLLSTGLAWGFPYPLFGVLLGGVAGKAAVLLDCLVLIHIVIGAWKAQRLSWFLMLAYNGFNLASLGVCLALLGAEELAPLLGDPASLRAFYVGAALSAGAMAALTLHAWRLRERFANRNPLLF